MALRALRIVEETMQGEIDRLYARMDRMVEEHATRIRVAREARKGRTDLKPCFSTPDEAFRYLDSCPIGPGEEGTFLNMPLDLFQQHRRLGQQAGRLALVLGRLVQKIEKECIEIPEEDLR